MTIRTGTQQQATVHVIDHDWMEASNGWLAWDKYNELTNNTYTDFNSYIS